MVSAGGYGAGRGVQQDFATSYMWLTLAIATLTGPTRHGAMKFRDTIAAAMTSAQVDEAQRPSRRGAHVGVPVQRKGHDLTEVGEKLKVKTVLEGSVRKAGNRLRINAQLINTEDGYHLWSERYDREMEDVFAVQDEIARTVVGKLQVTAIG